MIENLFREELKTFKPYETEKNNFNIRLDANESFFNLYGELKNELINVVSNTLFNRYPDPDSSEICRLYSNYAGVSPKNIMAGNGSDELIQIIINTIITTGDKVAMLSPDFSMYSIYTKLAGGIPVEFQLKRNFTLDVEALVEKVNSEGAKLLFISNPNNPTGGVIPEKDLLKIIEDTRSIVVIDEAYYEFYGETLAGKINLYENLIVLRTCSKAIGLAALRLGFLIANKLLVSELKKVKPPFNVNSVTQSIAAVVLSHPEIIKKNTKEILKEREFLINRIKDIKDITIYPSRANFILIESIYVEYLKNSALESCINVRSFTKSVLKNCLRITIGSREENIAFIKAISK